jgi:ATP/maltotriose-dependent transcriptional regulator MalT
LSAIWWAELVLRTGKVDQAFSKVNDTFQLCIDNGWGDDVARCHLIFGKVALVKEELAEAQSHLGKAEMIMRKGHMMTELPQVLLTQAEVLLAKSSFSAALQAADEGFELARLRGMLPTHAEALVVRGRIRLAQYSTEDPGGSQENGLLSKMAADDAQTALDIARGCDYLWGQRDALNLLAATEACMAGRIVNSPYRIEADTLGAQLGLQDC